jgi:hypothetical protein
MQMNSEANPLPTQGERNIFCPLYGCCLDQAARRAWPTWACSQCPNMSLTQPLCESEIPMNNAVSYYELPPKIDRMIW